jgi:hypothetical protein
MRANLFANDLLVGATDLIVDENMSAVHGFLQPTEAYVDNVQAAVWQSWTSSNPDITLWQTLRLNVQLANGWFLQPRDGITIYDLPERRNLPIRIKLTGLDRYPLETFFRQEPAKSFVPLPWEDISIRQKIAFENELTKELGPQKPQQTLLSLFKPAPKPHPLAGFEVSAICHDTRNDEVLFQLYKLGSTAGFAAVHLTWKGKQELPGFPGTQFYETFEEFLAFGLQED